MADQAAPNLAGIDFSQYRSWKQITTPRGGVYYVVPGTPYVYDPFASAARGQTVLYLNPTPEIEDRQRIIDNENANTRAQSPEGQLIPVVGGSVGTIGGAIVADRFFNGGRITGKPDLQTQSPQPTAPTTTPTTAQPTTPAEGFTQGAQTGAATTGAQGQVATPRVISVKGDVATVDTPGGPQEVPAEAANDPGFWSTVDWGKIAQGVMTLAQAYAAYRAYKSGDNTGAAIYGSAALASGASMAGSQTAAAAAPYLGAAAALYGGYQVAQYQADAPSGGRRNINSTAGGATAGATFGQSFGPVGTVIGAIVGGLAGFAGSQFGSSKNKAQMMRDSARKVLQEQGILDENWQGTLADGTKYDFGKDGSTLKWSEIDKVTKENKEAWDGAVPLTDALATAYGFVGQNASDFSAWYAKAAVSNANNDPEVAKANARHFALQQGITYDMIKQKLDEAKADGRIDEAQYNYYLGGAQQLAEGQLQATPGQPPAAVAPPPAAPQPSPPQAGAPVAPPPGTQAPAATLAPAPTTQPRSRTLSPGINLQGQRINYNEMGRRLADRYNRRRR